MGEVIFETVGTNYQVPGLPYEDTYQYVRPVIFNDVPTESQIKDLLTNSDENTLTNPWSVQVIRGFRDYIPTTFKRVTQDMPEELLLEYFGLDRNWVPEAERILLQLQTETEAKAATIDAAIVHGRADLGTVVNKAHVANRLYMIGRIYGHLSKRDYPFLFGDLTDRSKWPEALSDIKEQMSSYLMELPLGKRDFNVRIRKPDVSSEELKNYPFIEWFKEKLGDNFLGDLLYGSAARTDDPDKFSDYDNWVRVKDVRKAHEVLKNTKPAVVHGKLIENCPEDVDGWKHVGIHLFPEQDEYLLRHIRFLHDSIEFRKHTKVLYGEFPFPKLGMDEVVERGISHAYIKLKTIAGSLNWAWSSPERILGKPNLYEFIVKNIRFFLQHSLNAVEIPQFRDKEKLNSLLRDRGLKVPDYEPNLDHIQNSLLYAMVSVLKLQKELEAHNRNPNLQFMVDKEYQQIKELEEWEKMDDL